LSESTFKTRFLKQGFFSKKFLTGKYMKMASLDLKFKQKFFTAIANLYFLQKYTEKIFLPKAMSSKLKY
jgi:hypothetical protein